MKSLVKTKDYLLLIDEEVEIKENQLGWDGHYIEYFRLRWMEKDWEPIIAYYPLTNEAKELDLPLLPNPFEDNGEIGGNDFNEQLWEDYRKPLNRSMSHLEREAFIAGYRVAQSKRFSIENMRKIAQAAFTIKSNNETLIQDFDKWFKKRIQLLSTQQLPKEFIPEYERGVKKDGLKDLMKDEFYKNFPEELPNCVFERKLKIITNSQGKREAVGEYKY